MSLSEIFGLFFDMKPRFWMNLQTEFDMRMTMPRRMPPPDQRQAATGGASG
jgi:plasmid maintenance system antidote protein VapI